MIIFECWGKGTENWPEEARIRECWWEGPHDSLVYIYTQFIRSMESSLSCRGDNQSSIEIRGEVRITTTGLCWAERSRKWLNKSQRDTIENCGGRVGEKCRIKYNITCLVDISQVWRRHSGNS